MRSDNTSVRPSWRDGGSLSSGMVGAPTPRRPAPIAPSGPFPRRPSSISPNRAAISSNPSRPSVPFPPGPCFLSLRRVSRASTYSRMTSRARWISGAGSEMRKVRTVCVEADDWCDEPDGGVRSDVGGTLVAYCACRMAGAERAGTYETVSHSLVRNDGDSSQGLRADDLMDIPLILTRRASGRHHTASHLCCGDG